MTREEVDDHVQRRGAVLDRLRESLVDGLDLDIDPEAIDPDTPLFGSGLALDSIDAVELVLCLHADFGVELSEDRRSLASLRSVNTLVDLILSHAEAPDGAC